MLHITRYRGPLLPRQARCQVRQALGDYRPTRRPLA
jgi:hypothetical protein